MLRSVVIGCGGRLPDRVVTNAEMAKMVDTTDDWIVQRTGIRERRFAADGEYTSDLAIAASNAALTSAGVSGESVDAIVLATATPDDTFPATAADSLSTFRPCVRASSMRCRSPIRWFAPAKRNARW